MIGVKFKDKQFNDVINENETVRKMIQYEWHAFRLHSPSMTMDGVLLVSTDVWLSFILTTT